MGVNTAMFNEKHAAGAKASESEITRSDAGTTIIEKHTPIATANGAESSNNGSVMRRRLEKLISVFPHVFSANLSYILSNILYRIFSYICMGQICGLK